MTVTWGDPSSTERKLVTIMLCDIVDSTSLVYGQDPEDAASILRQGTDIMMDAVQRYGGVVGQMTGDGLLAVFGAPQAQEDHALRACLAADDIRLAAIADHVPFAIRIGVASGEIVAGIVRTAQWTDYRTVGSCVHLAGKLQKAAAPNTVLVSSATMNLIPAGLVTVGIYHPNPPFPVALGAVFQLHSVSVLPPSINDPTTNSNLPCFGRAPEIKVLASAIERMGHGQGGVLTVVGEAGIGKSRLLAETLRVVSSQKILPGRSELRWPQTPLRRLDDPGDLEQVARTLLSAAGDFEALYAGIEPSCGPMARMALHFLDGRTVDATWNELPDAARQDLCIRVLVAAAILLSARTPILAIVEDLHWASARMRLFLDALASSITTAPVRLLLLMTTRAGNASATFTDRRGSGFTTVGVGQLSPDAIQCYLDCWLGADPALSELKTSLIERSLGIPLYLVESLRALAQNGAIVGTPGSFRPGPVAASALLPPTIRALLAQRIDRLPPAARRVLLSAAVIGHVFDVHLLQQIDGDASAHLPLLEAEGLTERSRVLPNLEYRFHHALLQETAYAALTREDREQLHRRTLRALSQRTNISLPSRPELLAHHASAAGDWRLAYVFSRYAARTAENRSRLVEATRHYENALLALSQMPETARNTRRRIDLGISLPCLIVQRALDGADTYLAEAQSLSQAIDDPVRYARAAAMHVGVLWSNGRLDAAIDISRKGLAALNDRDDIKTRIPLLIRLAGVLAAKGAFEEACDAGAAAHVLLTPALMQERCGLAVKTGASCPINWAQACVEVGDTTKALALAKAAAAFADEQDHVFTKIFAYARTGDIYLTSGDAPEAAHMFEVAIGLSEAIHARQFHLFSMSGLALAKVLSGDLRSGRRWLTRSVEETSSTGALAPLLRGLFPWAATKQAEALLLIGQPREAHNVARQAMRVAHETGQIPLIACSQWLIGQALHALGGPDRSGQRYAQQAYDTAKRLGMRPLTQIITARMNRLFAGVTP